MSYYKNLSLLITHYNRSNSLERLLKSFKDLDCSFEDIVVSDDGSKVEHLDRIRQLQESYSFKLITSDKNRGLGNNMNKGQDAVQTPFTLYVQEDFVPKKQFAESLKRALKIVEERPDVDMVRFYAYFKYPYLKSYKYGFSEMRFSLFSPGYRKFYYYSDHPHLRRSDFFGKFGRYREGIKVEATEYAMMMSFLKGNGKAMFYDDYKGLFDQINSQQEPSTVNRNYWRESRNPFVFLLRHCYRHLRFNFDYLFSGR